MKPLLVGFGDSWTFGSELDLPREQPWLEHLGKRLDADTVNMSCPASSIEHVVVQLFDFIKNHDQQRKLIFMVGLSGQSRYLSYDSAGSSFVNITPEAVYTTQNIHHSGRPPDVVENFKPVFDAYYRHIDNRVYRKFLTTRTIFTIQSYCKLKNIPVLFFSYFDTPYLETHLLDMTTVIPQNLTVTMTGQEYILPSILDTEYFKGKLFHPNIKGHIKIADILYEKYAQTYTKA